MNRADRLRKVAPGATEGQIAALAELPGNTVVAVAMLAKQAGRDALAADRDRKRQRKQDDRKNKNIDEEEFTRRNLGVVSSQARRVWPEPEKPGDKRRINTTALEGLARVREHIDTEIANVVATSRAEGIPDAVIAEALGVTRAAIGQRYGRKGSFTQSDQAG